MLNAARRAGAADCLIVESQIASRVDAIRHSAMTHDNAVGYDAKFFAVVDKGIVCAELMRSSHSNASRDYLEKIVVDAVQAAHIVNAWGMCKPTPSLRAMVCPTSAQNTAAEWEKYKYCTSFDDVDGQCKTCAVDDCLASHDFDAAPILRILDDEMKRRWGEIDFEARQTITRTRKTFFFLDETIYQDRFETRIEQTAFLPNDAATPRLRLPDIRFDGILKAKDADLFHSALALPAFAPELMRSMRTTSDASNAPKNLHRIVLSPWAAAILLHETHHIGIDAEFPSSIIVDRSQNFCLPPSLPHTCKGFGIEPLETSDASRPSQRHEPDFSSLKTRSFVVDAPIRWMRHKKTHVDATFQIAAVASSQGFEQHFKSMRLRFDLSQIWKNATVHSAYAHAVSLPCADASVAYVLPWIAVDALGENAHGI